MLTYTDLRDARLEQLAAAADEWQRVADRFTALARDASAELTRPLRASRWAGDAATAAFGRLDALDDEFEVAALRATTAAIVLRHAAEEFTSLQQRLQSAAEGAVAAGLTVDGQGRVFPPYIAMSDLSDPEQHAIHQRNLDNVRIFEGLFVDIRIKATDADFTVTRTLESLGDLSAGHHDDWDYQQAGKAVRDAAAALGLDQDAIPTAGTDPAAVKAWWDGLSTDERQLYLSGWPEQVGALDGLPATDRDTANRQALRNYLGTNVHAGLDEGNYQHDRALDLLRRLEDESADPEKASLLLLGFDPEHDGKAVVALGNPDTAAHTAVVVPGVGTELEAYHKELKRAYALHGASTAAAGGPPVSIIAWLGYDTPGGGGPTGTSIMNAPFGADSEAGAEALDGFVDGLRTSHDSSPSHITGIGHSYGSTVYGVAASTGDGIAVDDIIVAGSPGMRVDDAGELSTKHAHTWATAADSDDLVARSENNIWLGVLGDELVKPIHGPAPHDPEFGARILHADTYGHSGYWDASDILTAQAAVIVGDYPTAEQYQEVPDR